MKPSYLLIIQLIISTSLFSQIVQVDTEYVNNGINQLNIDDPTDNQSLLSKIQDDDKVLLCGSIVTSSFTEYPFVTRVLEDGELDSTFGSDGILIDSNFVDFTPYSMELQDDGKIVIAGHQVSFDTPGGEVSGLIVRYNSDGTLDSTFNSSGSIAIRPTDHNYFGRSIAISNGNIYLSGYIYLSNSDYDFFCAKLDITGVLDDSFGANGVAQLNFGGLDVSRGVSVQSDNKVIVSGYKENTFTPVIARLNPDGSLDSSFSTNYENSNPQALGAIYQTIIGDSDLITGIGFSYDTGTGRINAFVSRINADGSLDNTFADNGELTYNITGEDTYGIYGAYYDNGKLMVVGNSGEASNFDMKLFAIGIDSSGDVDLSFVENGVYTDIDSTGYNLLNAVHLNSDNKLIASGYTEVASFKHKPLIVQFEIIEGTTSISTYEEDLSVLLYPNPVSNNLLIIENTQDEDLLYNITNPAGQVVSDFKLLLAKQQAEVTVQLTEGFYFLNFYNQDGDSKISSKILVK